MAYFRTLVVLLFFLFYSTAYSNEYTIYKAGNVTAHSPGGVCAKLVAVNAHYNSYHHSSNTVCRLQTVKTINGQNYAVKAGEVPIQKITCNQEYIPTADYIADKSSKGERFVQFPKSQGSKAMKFYTCDNHCQFENVNIFASLGSESLVCDGGDVCGAFVRTKGLGKFCDLPNYVTPENVLNSRELDFNKVEKLPDGCIQSAKTGRRLCTFSGKKPDNCIYNSKGKKVCSSSFKAKNCITNKKGQKLCKDNKATEDSSITVSFVYESDILKRYKKKKGKEHTTGSGEGKGDGKEDGIGTGGQGNGDGKEDGKDDGKQDGKGDGKEDGKGDGKQDGKGDGKEDGKKDKGSIGSGNCKSKAPPACSGDAIQCYIAKQQFLNTCESKKSNDSLESLGESSGNWQQTSDNEFSQAMDGLKNGEQVNIPSSLNQSGLGWGRSCPANFVLDFKNKIGIVNVSSDLYCKWLSIAGNILFGFNLLFAAMFVIKGI